MHDACSAFHGARALAYNSAWEQPRRRVRTRRSGCARRRGASDWVHPGGRGPPPLLRGAKVSADKASVPGVVLKHARNMKEPSCLATSLSSKTASETREALWRRRFTLEETFRWPESDPSFPIGDLTSDSRRAGLDELRSRYALRLAQSEGKRSWHGWRWYGRYANNHCARAPAFCLRRSRRLRLHGGRRRVGRGHGGSQ